MLRKKIRFLPLLLITALSLLLTEKAGRGTITSIILTPANPTTMSNTLGYYLAGKAYTFTINVVDPDVTAWNQITDARMTIANTTNIVVRNTVAFGFGASPLVADTPFAVTVDSGTVDAAGLVTAGSTYNNFTVRFTVTFRWDTPASAWAAARNVIGSATTNNPAVNTLTDTRTVSYGVVSTIRIVGFAQDGDAADGRVNPWHTAFNVTGTIAYNIPGAVAADAVHLVADAGVGEYTAPGSTLYRSGFITPHVDATPAALSIPVSAEWFNSLGWVTARGNHTWTVRVAMNTAGGPETSVNTLAINCDRIRVTNIEFFGGGGVNPPPRYYRSVNLPGTQVRVTAQLENAGTGMVGNTTIRISDSAGTPNTYDVVIANGATQGVIDMSANYPAVPGDIPANDTTVLSYSAVRVFGGAYDGDTAAAEGQDDFGSITQAALGTYQIYWDHEDPPGANAGGFTTWVNQQTTATSLELTWTPINPLANDDHDFYSYRIYYREDTTVPWIMIDRNTANYGPPAGTFRLDLITTGTAAIQGLVPLTMYDYFVSAVDVFGNEIYTLFPGSIITGPTGADWWGEIQTQPLTILSEITDGVTIFQDNSFTLNPLASARPVRDTAIRVKLTISGTAITLPETVNLIVAQDGATDLISGGTVNPIPVEPWYRINCAKSGPNIWTAHIPDTNTLITIGTDVRFVIEMIHGASITYADHNSELEIPAGVPPVTPNDYEWTFSVITPTTFQPWPTRILNNVITDKDPVAYPAYYLSEDAYVTIKAFDIKGRPVATLLDNAFRKGGQNIKEGGWRGDNKANRKLGVGLYYIQIEAKAVSSGKVILNSFQKVVMAR
ncbi:MAG TPA: fibronectin type III domain-containing protein [Spirochaetota bacterium]|nr:fibronectin type III domain-containing protein [Spirochaetota bacterium]